MFNEMLSNISRLTTLKLIKEEREGGEKGEGKGKRREGGVGEEGQGRTYYPATYPLSLKGLYPRVSLLMIKFIISFLFVKRRFKIKDISV